MSSPFPPPPPPGLNYTAAIRPSLNFILILTPLGSILVPVILVLFFFSTKDSRRHPVFILNILACCSGIFEAGLNAALETKQIIYPNEPVSPTLLTAVIAFAIVSPVFIDSILLFRLLAFFPRPQTPRHTLAAILATPILVKCGRFIAVVLYLHTFTHSSGKLPSVLLAAQSTWPRNPYIMTEFILQMVDNFYASAFFLYKLYQFQHEGKTDTRSRTLISHIRALFLIALGNFIFPVIMNIASIVLIATDPSFINGSSILLSNNYVAILGVVFATIWTNRQNWNKRAISAPTIDNRMENSSFDPSSRRNVSTIRFDFAPYASNDEINSSRSESESDLAGASKKKEGMAGP
ncbi:hypothetical protein BDZ94DRAFT_1249604 [Collybia nuda]|uniref:Uncharacterized protein n=1 Tax=Collybia nuda TaxID=64659 RepID=A0A9P5YDY6_9AGAR|nr:hypothetical protein BDZ94DRAFT_1249604 [Collybia nuda]